MPPDRRPTLRLLLAAACAGVAAHAVLPAASAAPPAPSAGGNWQQAMAQQVVRHAGIDSACAAAAADGSLVLVVFTAGPGSAAAEWFDRVTRDPAFADHAGPLQVVHVPAPAQPDAASRFRVHQVPDAILMSAEQKLVARVAGADAMMSAEALRQWTEAAKARAARGQWLGLEAADDAPRPARLRGERRLEEALAMLGDPEPAARDEARRALVAMGEEAFPVLVEALGNEYLGTRVGAAETLAALGEAVPRVDPWAGPEARAEQIAALEAWWEEQGGRLPDLEQQPPAATGETRTVEAALQAIGGDNPLRRTDAMSVLVRQGPPALPRVRQAIERASREQDQKTLWLLEDVRWSILIPTELERRVSARNALARGTSEERQAAATRLGGAGAAGLPALRELVSDGDPLVRESAAHALTRVGGDEALLAMAALLGARDSNLRMVAAQQLGATKDARAATHLAAVLRDPDEVVAATAIAAVAEVGAADQADALIACLDDERWRIRAAAAKALGQLEVRKAASHLNGLLEDTDVFVARSALDALKQIGHTPRRDTLLALVERDPTLLPTVVESIMDDDDDATLATLESLYDRVDEAGREAVLQGLAGVRYYGTQSEDHWLPLLQKAAASPSVRVRASLVGVLANRSPATAAEFITPLLNDEDRAIRLGAAELVAPVAAFHWGLGGRAGIRGYGVLAGLEALRELRSQGLDEAQIDEAMEEQAAEAVLQEAEPVRLAYGAGGEGPQEAAGVAGSDTEAEGERVAAMHEAWHRRLRLMMEESDPPPAVLLAAAVTGDPADLLPRLLEAAEGASSREAFFRELDRSGAAPLLIRRLPWPEGRPLVEALLSHPATYASLLDSAGRLEGEAGTLLLDPDLMVRMIENARSDALETLARGLLGTDGGGMSLARPGTRTDAIVDRLLASEAAPARCLGLYALAVRGDERWLTRFEDALSDPDPFVRRAAILGVAGAAEPGAVERLLAPVLADADPRVFRRAVESLLTPSLASALELPDAAEYFLYGDAHAYLPRMSSYSNRPTPPIEAVSREPGFLEGLAARLREPAVADDDELRPLVALLLAQYGETAPIEAEFERWQAAGGREASPALMAALPLTNDVRYLPVVRVAVAEAGDRYDLQALLAYLRGVRGAEVRDLRREINLKMRQLN